MKVVSLLVVEIKTDIRTAGALLDQFYEKRRVLIVSTPSATDQYYKIQNIMLQVCYLYHSTEGTSTDISNTNTFLFKNMFNLLDSWMWSGSSTCDCDRTDRNSTWRSGPD